MVERFNADAARELLKRLEGFTEGPWRIEESGTGCDYETHITHGSGGRANTVTGRLGSACGDEDARVMAAAPDLHKHLTAALAYIVACEEIVGPDYVNGVPVPTSLISRIRSLRMAASVEAKEADKYRSLWRSESQARRAEREGVAESFAKLRKERDMLSTHAHELETAVGKPIAGPWVEILGGHTRYLYPMGPTWPMGPSKVALVDRDWAVVRPAVESWEADGGICGNGPETGDAGKHAADMAIKDLYHLMGGIHPAPAPVTVTP